ncbi:MAG: low molecular weight protein-tyrosine-phosphatase, partial [Planctomycetota bacterium]
LGNICRSPMAEALFVHEVQQRGLADDWQAASAGTGAWHVGEPPDSRAATALRKRGIPVAHKARQVQAADFDRFDHIIAMDGDNLAVLEDLRPGRGPQPRLFGDWDPAGAGDVGDPYYGGPEGFERVYEQVLRCCRGFLDAHG